MCVMKKWFFGGVALAVFSCADLNAADTNQHPERAVADLALSVSLGVKTERQKESFKTLLSLDCDKRGEKAQDDRVKQNFNLQNTEDSDLLESCLVRGGVRIDYLDTVFITLGTNSIPWLLSKYDGHSVHVKAYILHILWKLDSSDVFEFLLAQMDDKTEVPNDHAKAVAPPGYRHLRICDLTCDAVTFKLTRSDSGFQSVVKERYIDPLAPIAKRDSRIAELKAIIAEHPREYSALLDRLPKLIKEAKEKAEKGKQ